MCNASDFIIENGVLTRYVGPGGDVVIPEGVTTIGLSAFSWCCCLRTITITDGVTVIGDSAFWECTYLTAVIIPDSVTAIGNDAFLGCSSLQTITLSDNITTIGKNAFSGCNRLQSITIPNSVTQIGTDAFANCWDLQSVTISNALIAIAKGMFSCCSNLLNIILPNGVTTIGKDAFLGCSNLQTINLPNSVTTIGENAFSGCHNLRAITIPDSVKAIGSGAFCGIDGLMEINVDFRNKKYCSQDGIIYSKDLTELIRHPPGKADASLTIPDSVTIISAGAFSECNNLQFVTIPPNVTTIGAGAFYRCSNLRSISILGSDTTIGYNAFCDCSSLQSLVIPDGKIVIANTILDCCESFEFIVAPRTPFAIFKRAKLALPALVGYISNFSAYTDKIINSEYQKYMYSQRKRLLPDIFKRDLVAGVVIYAEAGKMTAQNIDEEFIMPAQQAGAVQCTAYLMEWKSKNISQDSINYYFKQELNKDPLNAVDMKKVWSYTELDDASLALTSYKGESDFVVIPERIGNVRVTAIADQTFSPLKYGRRKSQGKVLANVVNVIISEGVIAIGSEAFSGCSSLKTITIPDSVATIGAGAFYKCSSLQCVTIPQSVTMIGGYAFYDCTSLQTITIPSAVTSIGREAFCLCDKLTICAPAGSYAETYAKENNIPFVAE